MRRAKIAVTIDGQLLERLDEWVTSAGLPSRSGAVQEAVKEKLARVDRRRLARECAKLDPAAEQAMAEQGFAGEADLWPEY